MNRKTQKKYIFLYFIYFLGNCNFFLNLIGMEPMAEMTDDDDEEIDWDQVLGSSRRHYCHPVTMWMTL